MNSTLSIEVTQKRSIKQVTKELIGKAISTCATQRTKELLRSPVSQPVSLQDKLLMAYLKRRAMLENQDDFFERLHTDFWEGDGGAVFSKNCDHRFEELFLDKQKQDFDQLRSIWNQRQPNHIVEFGCNSGLLLNYMTSELDGIQTSTGIEINAEQVRHNQEATHFDSRINFVHADGGEWLFENGNANTLFVSNGGVLEYFCRERLNEMLTLISNNLQPAIFFAVEPYANDHDWSKTTASIPFGEELSFSHNYTDLFESNGFQISHQRAVEFDSWKMMATIAVTKWNFFQKRGLLHQAKSLFADAKRSLQYSISCIVCLNQRLRPTRFPIQNMPRQFWLVSFKAGSRPGKWRLLETSKDLRCLYRNDYFV